MGTSFGPDPEGEHGLFYFRTNLDRLKIDSKNNIEFDFKRGHLFTEQITIENYTDSLDIENAGFSREIMFYKGQISGNLITLNCSSEYSDCYDSTMTFKLKK